MPPSGRKIKIYTLSTCIHCKKAKAYLQDCQVPFEFVDVDLLSGTEKKSVLDEVKQVNPGLTFPTILVGEDIIVGFNEEKLKKAMEQ